MQTLARRFKAVKIGIMRSDEFIELSGVMMMGKAELSEDFPTAGTDGRNEIYGIKFITALADKELGFVIVHENVHKAARHTTLYYNLHKLDARLANMACDYWINGRILKADPIGKVVTMPRDAQGNITGLHDCKYDGWPVLKIFRHLQENGAPPPPQGKGKGEGEGEGDSQGQSDNFDEHDWEAAQELSDAERKEQAEDVKQAVRQGAMAAKRAGVGGKSGRLGLGELLQSKVCWEQEMAEFISSACVSKDESTWSRPNRRFLHTGLIMPSLIGEAIREAVLAIDASWSMAGDRLTRVVSEVQALAEQVNIDKVHVLYWDGRVEKHEIYRGEEFKTFSADTTPSGGGGTDPTCVPDYLAKEGITPDFTLMLTDGEVNSWGEWSTPVLWAITNTRTITAPVGKTININ
jgi:predicted metal-dependent peptidase